MTNAEARFNKSLRPRKPVGLLERTAQDVHLDSHTAPELWGEATHCVKYEFICGGLPYVSLFSVYWYSNTFCCCCFLVVRVCDVCSLCILEYCGALVSLNKCTLCNPHTVTFFVFVKSLLHDGYLFFFCHMCHAWSIFMYSLMKHICLSHHTHILSSWPLFIGFCYFTLTDFCWGKQNYGHKSGQRKTVIQECSVVYMYGNDWIWL